MNPNDPRFGRGVDLFNRDAYFEAHDVWEELWRESRGDARTFLQGMIQAASAIHHMRHGNPRGARMLYESAMARLTDDEARRWGVDLSALRRDLTRALDGILDRPWSTLAGRGFPEGFRVADEGARRVRLIREASIG